MALSVTSRLSIYVLIAATDIKYLAQPWLGVFAAGGSGGGPGTAGAGAFGGSRCAHQGGHDLGDVVGRAGAALHAEAGGPEGAEEAAAV